MRRRRAWLTALVLTTAVVSASSQPPSQSPPAAQRPTFRTAANYVRVDVYPTIDGQIVTGLRAEDFEVREDGAVQKLDSVRFIDPGPPVPQEVRVEPNSVQESLDAAADPRARLFVIFIDTYHLNWTSGIKAYEAFAQMLTQSIGRHDLIGVMTPEMSAGSVTFGRRTAVLEETLQRYFDLSRSDDTVRIMDPEDNLYLACYGEGYPASAMIERRHEALTLGALQDLVTFLGGIREERKTIFAVSEGWEPTRADPDLANWSDSISPKVQKPRVDSDGRLRASGSQWENGGSNRGKCDQQRIKLAGEDHQSEFQRLIDLSNRANASFYAVDLRGLTASPSARAPLGQEMLKTLSSATDGTAVVDRNDLGAGVRHAMDDMRGYYLLGYYSTNAKADGTFRAIKVRVNRPGVDVRARRGYLAATEKALNQAAARPTAVAPTAAPTSAPTGQVTEALSALSRFRREAVVRARAGYTWRAGAGDGAQALIWVAGEFDAISVARSEQWDEGADVSLDLIGPNGSSVDVARQSLTRDARSFVVRLPAGAAVGPGAYDIRITSKAAGAAHGASETLRVVVPAVAAGVGPAVGQAELFRRGPFTGPGWVPAADLRFRRQERVKVEAVIVGPVTSASARLLDRAGSPLPLPVAFLQREEGGARIVSGELALAPLTSGDYLLEISVVGGSSTRRELAAFRIIP